MAEVIQEYLVRIGYQTDQTSFHNFEESLGAVGKKVFKLGTAITEIGIAAASAFTAFAYNMRKMYFSSQLADTSAKNMMGMAYAGKAVGISSDAMKQSITSLARELRANPALETFIESVTGLSTAGKDASEKMIMLFDALNKMPEQRALPILPQFGIDQDTYHQYRQNSEVFKERLANFEKMLKEQNMSNKTYEDGKKQIEDYTNQFDNLLAKLDIFEKKVGLKVAPVMNDIINFANEVTTAWSYAVDGLDEFGQHWEEWMKKFDPKDRFGAIGRFLFGDDKGKGGLTKEKVGKSIDEIIEFLVPSVKARESGGDPKAVSPKGAKGLFQLMPETAKRFGVTDSFNPEQNEKGARAYLEYLLKRYNGDVNLALGAYNWGEGNIDDFINKGHGHKKKSNPNGSLPYETWDYVKKITGGNLNDYKGYNQKTSNITQNNIYNITGSDSSQIAASVATKSDNTWSKITRNNSSVVV